MANRRPDGRNSLLADGSRETVHEWDDEDPDAVRCPPLPRRRRIPARSPALPDHGRDAPDKAPRDTARRLQAHDVKGAEAEAAHEEVSTLRAGPDDWDRDPPPRIPPVSSSGRHPAADVRGEPCTTTTRVSRGSNMSAWRTATSRTSRSVRPS
ncbi:hypothetical protein GCM10019016_098600 [Streptomyces prasinosporus]|uniref:Uncharacterized protein n=1 Tax=Streptomyces prasinosporus TaxID=68256 RepID=A0ABP6U922_9ACTN